MPVAPLVSAWRFPLGATRGAGAALRGVPFCTDEFGANARLIVLVAFGAELTADPTTWTWQDVSDDVRYADSGRVVISPLGRSDETSTAQPAGCAFELDNSAGDYTPYMATGRWYPYVRRNTPVRVLLNFTGYPNDDVLRFEGAITGWNPGWDISAQVATVAISAQGVTRRLAQGTTPLKPALTRSINALGPSAFWAMDEADTATILGSGVVGGSAMTFTDGVALGSYTDLAGAVRAPDIGDGSLHGVVDSTLVPDHVDTTWSMGFAMKVGSVALNDPLSFRPLLTLNSDGEYYRWDVTLLVSSFGDITLQQSSTAGLGVSFNFSPPSGVSALFDGTWHYYEFTVTYTAASNRTRVSCTIDGVSAGGSSNATITTATTCGIKSVDINLDQQDFGPFGVSGLYVLNGSAPSTPAGAAADGYTGESPVDRLARLCREESVPINITGASSTTMGPQGVDSFLKLLRECETSDQGVLYDGRGPGLAYVSRAARYNLTPALTIDAAADQLGYPFAPIDDDQRNRNLVKASRDKGASATFEDATGALGTAAIGIYDSSITVSVAEDAAVLDYASWLVHLGTVEGFRWPKLSLDLRASPELAADWLRCSVSSRLDVTGVASVATQHPSDDVRLILEGWQETLSPLDWTVQANTSQYGPWDVGVLDSTSFLDCGASFLAADITAADTAIPLMITDTCTWTHASGNFDVRIGAEVMTVTAVGAATGSGSAWVQTLTVTRGAAGVVTPHAALAEVHVDSPIVLAL